MFTPKRILPIVLFAATLSATWFTGRDAHAQLSLPTYTTTYCVQVKWEMWRSGGTYWANEYESTDQADAELMFAFFEAAFENGTLCEIIGCSFDWIPIDVRLTTRRDWNLYPVSPAPLFSYERLR